jgi:hypothetical protein
MLSHYAKPLRFGCAIPHYFFNGVRGFKLNLDGDVLASRLHIDSSVRIVGPFNGIGVLSYLLHSHNKCDTPRKWPNSQRTEHFCWFSTSNPGISSTMVNSDMGFCDY